MLIRKLFSSWTHVGACLVFLVVCVFRTILAGAHRSAIDLNKANFHMEQTVLGEPSESMREMIRQLLEKKLDNTAAGADHAPAFQHTYPLSSVSAAKNAAGSKA